ncbi:MAG: hypothetical protein EXR62_05830 [Chloroflexi bacterium]|nr:hypothetical protein [Chloroflexota bacterium]
MTRTRVVFILVIALALAIIGASFLVQRLNPTGAGSIPAVPEPSVLEVRLLVALPIESWVQEVARQYNGENHKLESKPVHVTVTPMDGLTAMGRYERGELNPLPTAWIPDSRYLVELVNAAYKEKLGRDVFLSDGEYRARPIAISLFTWGIYQSRAAVLRKHFSTIDWKAIHDAATAKSGWPELGGKPEWGYFKLVVPNPRRNVGGLAAMVAAAGEYYGKTTITVADITNPAFQTWLRELMGAVTDFSSLGSYTVENLALFGYSVGDGGQLLESDLLTNMAGIQQRWEDPLVVVYPEYVTWFDFPFSTWMGAETTALEKNAALDFQKYLLSPAIQQKGVAQGLRPGNTEISITGPDSLFVRWQTQGAQTVVPRSTAMRPPDRDVLLALLRWFDLNVANR